MKKVNVSLDRVISAVEADENLGFCLSCGKEAYDVEPDARDLKCDFCGESDVYGAEECLVMLAA